MKLELLGVLFPITGAKRLTSYLLSVGMEMLDGGDDVDGGGGKRDLQLIAAIDNFKFQLRRRSHSEAVDRISPTMSSSVHAARRIVARALVGTRSDLQEQHGEISDEAGNVRENRDNVRYAVVNGLGGIWYALSAGSPVTLEELGVLRRGGKGAKERATLEKMTRIKKNIRQFRSENQNYYKSFMSKLANVAQNLKTMHDGSHMGVAQSQGNSLKEAYDHLNGFAESKGKQLELLDKAYDCSIIAMSTTNSSSLAAIVPASIIAVSTSYAKNAKNVSPAEAKMRVFGGTFKMIIDKLKPCWDTEFANITTEKLKVVEFLMDIASFISLLPPENVVLPSLDDRLVKVFGGLCVWKPEMLQRYPELGRAVLCSYRSRTSDNFERDAIQCLLDSDKPMGDELADSRIDSDLPEPKAGRTAQSWYSLYLENWIGLPRDNSEFYHYAEKGLLHKLTTLYDKDTKDFPLDETIWNHAAKGGQLDVLRWLRDKGCSYGSKTSVAAAYGGHLNVLESWAVDKGYGMDDMTCSAAALGGHLDVLKWACAKEKTFLNKQVCSNAAFNGHMEILKWAREKQCPWDEHVVCYMAAFGGHLEILKWARQEGCNWDENTCSYAAKGGHLEILKWARENECPWNKRTRIEADEEGFQEIVEWAMANGCP